METIKYLIKTIAVCLLFFLFILMMHNAARNINKNQIEHCKRNGGYVVLGQHDWFESCIYEIEK